MTHDNTASDSMGSLCERLRGLLAKSDGPNGHDWMHPWKVVPSDGKPIIASNRGGNLFKGFIATWDEADLIVEAINALPILLDALENPKASTLDADRERIARIICATFGDDPDGHEGWKGRTRTISKYLEAADALLASPNASRGEPIVPPENGETDPEWRAIRRAIDQFAGRVPTISKHRAVHNEHLRQIVERLDEAGDREAADTIVWQAWFRALDRERERFLLSDTQPNASNGVSEGWRTIESAPRDGTHFLATTLVRNISNDTEWWETHVIWADDEHGGVHHDCEAGWSRIEDYSHWMPLPASPDTDRNPA